MKTSNRLILSTSPLSQPARKPRETASLTHRQRFLYGRKRCYPTGKERDNETGLYYYGARYLDSKTSRWLSGDPAMGDYVPSAPINDEARKRNGNLPGQGGVFNYVNLHVYHYAGNNPINYIDPNGRFNIEGDTIICDLKDIEDLEKANIALNMIDPVNGGYAYNKVIATDGDQISIAFDTREDFGEYLGLGITYDQIVEAVNSVATGASLGSIGFADISKELSKSLGGIGFGFSLMSLGFAGNEAKKDRNWDTISDVAISAIGVIPRPEFTFLSLGLKYTKQGVKGVMKAGEALCDFNENYPHYYNKLYNYHTGGW